MKMEKKELTLNELDNVNGGLIVKDAAKKRFGHELSR